MNHSQANRILLLKEDCQTLILEAVLLCGEQGIATIEPTSYWSSKSRVVTTSPENTFTKAFPELLSKVIKAAVNATRVFELHFSNDVDATLASWASAVPLQKIRHLRLMVGHEIIVDSMPTVKTICPANHRPQFQLAKLLERLLGLVDLELQLNITYADIDIWSKRAIEFTTKTFATSSSIGSWAHSKLRPTCSPFASSTAMQVIGAKGPQVTLTSSA